MIPRRGEDPTLHGAPTYDFPKFSKKMHEIENILGRWGTPGVPLRSATAFNTTVFELILKPVPLNCELNTLSFQPGRFNQKASSDNRKIIEVHLIYKVPVEPGYMHCSAPISVTIVV